jgi:hypothetical protein
MTNAPSNSATAKAESSAETRKIVLKEIGVNWNKFLQQDLSGFKSKDDVVTQVVASTASIRLRLSATSTP